MRYVHEEAAEMPFRGHKPPTTFKPAKPMDDTDKTGLTDLTMHEHEDEDLVMNNVIQEDPELMYLHVCLSELLCKQEESV